MTSITDIVSKMHDDGFRTIPAWNAKPRRGYDKGQNYPATDSSWSEANMIGLALDSTILIDFDANKGDDPNEWLDTCITPTEFGEYFDISDSDMEQAEFQINKAGNSLHLLFRWPEGVFNKDEYHQSRNGAKSEHKEPDLVINGKYGVDIKTGNQLVYLKSHKALLNTSPDNLPVASEKLINFLKKPESNYQAPDYIPQPLTSGDGTPYGLKALQGICEDMTRAGEGTRNTTLNEQACKAGSLIAGSELSEGYAMHELEQAALSTGMKHSEVKATLNSGIKAGMQKPRTAPEKQDEPLVFIDDSAELLASGQLVEIRPGVLAKPKKVTVEYEAGLKETQIIHNELKAEPVVPVGKEKEFRLFVGSEGFDTEQNYLIKDYLPAESFGILYGKSGSFKSFHAVSWAASIATGKEWNGKKSRPGTVVYVAAEGGPGIPKRIKGWEDEFNNKEVIRNLLTVKHPVFVGSNDQVTTMINTIRAAERMTGQKVTAVILDTLARCFAGADENKAADMNLFIAGCDKIKANTGASIIVVHHSGKDEEKGARGSSALRAAADFEFRVDRLEGEQATYTLTHTKSKDSEEQKRQAFELKSKFLFTDSDGDDQYTLVATGQGGEVPEPEQETKIKPLGKNKEAVLQAVRSRMAAGEPRTYKVVRDDLKAQGIKISNYSNWVTDLVEDGYLEKRGDDLIPLIKQTADGNFTCLSDG
ncbi:AAA family ATPase [Endozoicomonas euniceicola]|uniref:AAA family ATPase n=1 Tax=Endozoicomonas euniceicola TaxID=1234143 RepID=A0ABY6GMU2_9GAMM|nr:AAA family ATPase [Endozoicomonas euniceicola]UYM14047.1 AAA family ATPase [Endozoicomonas euniceicola]